MMQDTHQLRCTGCARVIAHEDLKDTFRCPECGDLYEVEYPAWSVSAATASKRNFPNASALRWLWKERRASTDLKDQSGVWRFRELLPILRDHVVPMIMQLPGFHSGTWLTGNADGRGLSLTVWDTEENAQAMAERFGPRSSPAASASVVRCEVREVAATA